jgi:hypothetical protein
LFLNSALDELRAGGHAWTAGEIDEWLRRPGFIAIEAVTPARSILYWAGNLAEGAGLTGVFRMETYGSGTST